MPPVGEHTSRLIDGIERFAGRAFHFHSEVASLIEIASGNGRRMLFHDLIFLAKFLRNAHAVLERIGPSGEGYEKLSVEFRESLEKFTTLLKTLVKESPEDMKSSFRMLFFSPSRESLENLMHLAADLSWIKNYAIDTKRSVP